MKKGLLIGLALGLVVAVASPALAIDWSGSGWMVTKFTLDRNVGNNNGLPVAGDRMDDTESWVETRFRLSVKAAASEDLYGLMQFEFDASPWGANGGAWGTDQVRLEIKHAYVDFRVPPSLPVWMRVGLQWFGVRGNVCLNKDGAGITGRVKLGPVSIMPFWAKQVEGSLFEEDDEDIYGVDANVAFGGIKVGGYFIYEEDRQNVDVYDQHLYWFGLYSDGKVAMVKYNFDFSYSGGQEDDNVGVADIDVNGWLIRAVASVDINIFNVGMGIMYTSGDERNSVDEIEGYIQPWNSEATGGNSDMLILNGGWNGTGWTQSNSGIARGNYGGINTLSGVNNVHFSGFWYIRAFASVKPLDWLKISGQIGYIGDTTDDGDTFNATSVTDDNDVGWEFDIGASVNIYKELTLNTAFGYLAAGDALDNDVGDSPNDPWIWVSTLVYKF